MQALEMEEAESLMTSRKTISHGSSNISNINNNSKKRNAGAGGFLASLVVQRNFLTNVVLVAAGALLMLIYLGSTDQGTSDASGGTSPNVSPSKTVSKVSSPTTSPSEVQSGSTTTPAPMEDPVVVDPVPSPVEAPAAAPKPGNGNSPETQIDGGEDGIDNLPDPINVYSKFATFSPLLGQPLAEGEAAEALKKQWGEWHFWDDEEDERPSVDFMDQYPNRDIPSEKIPETAWQADAVFVNHYLSDAGKLVDRAMEAIYAEYGYSSEGMSAQELAERSTKIFHWRHTDGWDLSNIPADQKRNKRLGNGGGFMPRKSQDGLVRRLLHAMMTSGTFTIVLGGHSVAAGSGNGAQQSYIMACHKVLAPVFARLGVKLETRNMAQGGLGTIQASLGMQSIYGDEIDVLLWDSGMTEGGLGHSDMFARQAAMGKKVPFLFGYGMNMQLMQELFEAGMDVGLYLDGKEGIPETTSVEQAEKLPYAVRYLRCSDDMKDFCKSVPRFCWRCWLDNDHNVTSTPQKVHYSDNGNWHPGWRELQIRGRNLAMMFLRSLREAIELWTEQAQVGNPLDEEFWHVTAYYANIKSQMKSRNSTICADGMKFAPRVCDVPLYAFTQFTPRYKPQETGITSVAKAAPDGTKPENKLIPVLDDINIPMNPCAMLPDDAVDVYSIVAGRRRHLEDRALVHHRPSTKISQANHTSASMGPHFRNLETGIVPGKGWEVFGELVGSCDGSYNTVCYMGEISDCLLANYNSGRGVVRGDEFSGWLVLEIGPVKEGLILAKIDPWKQEVTMTNNWTTVNNERRKLKGYEIQGQSEEMIFEFAIDGEITSLNFVDFKEKLSRIQRTVYVLPILDDPSFSKEKVEIAFRMRNCGRKCAYGISHVYFG